MAIVLGYALSERVQPWDHLRAPVAHARSDSGPAAAGRVPVAAVDPIAPGREHGARDRRAALVFLAHQLGSETTEAESTDDFSVASDAYRRSQEMTQALDRPHVGVLDRFENGRAISLVDLLI